MTIYVLEIPALNSRGTPLFLAIMFIASAQAYQDVCMADTFKAQCDPGDVIVMESAVYGRMDTTSCLQTGADDIGCSNDVLYVLDQWCSGRQQCDFVPIMELGKIKSQWCGDLISFMRADFSCLSVVTREPSDCHSGAAMTLTQHEGFLASHVTEETGCGSPSSPWVIETQPGQTINLKLLDFGDLNIKEPHPGLCSNTYTTVTERSTGSNQSICGGLQRKRDVYTSKSHVVAIEINSKRNTNGRFILHFQTIGCADLSPPTHAWYTREGNQATIGCDVTERVWHLQCEENSWKGVVGNCSVAKKETSTNKKYTAKLPNVTIVILGVIIVSTVVLSLIILSIGCYHSRRYRRSHRVNKEQMTALTIYRKSTETANSHYRPVSTCSSCHGTLPTRGRTQDQDPSPKNPNTAPGYAHIWERPLPDPHHKRAPSAGSEYLSPKNTDSARSNPPRGASDTQNTSLLDEENASSFYSPETGHKYYVLDQAQC